MKIRQLLINTPARTVAVTSVSLQVPNRLPAGGFVVEPDGKVVHFPSARLDSYLAAVTAQLRVGVTNPGALVDRGEGAES
jgi:hypothetical protein